MKRLRILPVLLLSFFVGNTAFSAIIEKSGEWEIIEHEFAVTAQIHGNIIHGDQQIFFFPKRDCEKVGHLFLVLTIQTNRPKTVEGKVLPIEFNGKKTSAKAIRSYKYAGGHLFSFSLGYHNKDVLLKKLQKGKSLTIRLGDGDGFIASEFFDRTYNEWAFEGIEEAFSKAHKVCTKATKWRKA